MNSLQQQQNRMEAIRRSAENIRSSNLLNDTFVSIALEDADACQYVLRTILKKDDLNVTAVKGQYRLLNLTAKDSILDVFAQDSTGRLLNLEIQRRDTVDHARRTRFYSSMMDKSSLDKGFEYQELPDEYVIYISETDLWHAGKALYKVEKALGTGTDAIPYDDGSHIIYVNAEVDDGSDIAKMMQYFKSADPDDLSQDALSRRVRYLKHEKGGYDLMCAEAEKLYNLGVEDGIEQGIEQGIEKGIEQGIEKGIKQGIEKGIKQGIEQGIKQGIEQGVEKGIEQGIEKGIKKGIEQGVAQSEMNQAREKAAAVIRMLKDKLPVEKIAGYQNMPIDEVHKIKAEMLANA